MNKFWQIFYVIGQMLNVLNNQILNIYPSHLVTLVVRISFGVLNCKIFCIFYKIHFYELVSKSLVRGKQFYDKKIL